MDKNPYLNRPSKLLHLVYISDLYRCTLVSIALLLTSCVSTELTSVWVDQQNAKTYKNLLVIGISDKKHNRRIHEDAVAAVLLKQGIQATSSYRVISSISDLGAIDTDANDANAIDVDTIIEKLPDNDFDAILITHVLGIDKVSVNHPPSIRIVPYRYYDHHYRYYSPSFTHVYIPSYTSNHVIVHQTTSLYDSASSSLVWSGQTKTVDPRSTEKLASDLAKKIVGSLKQAALILTP